MFTCYIDESGTDSNSNVAVVGGLALDIKSFTWLDIAWRKCLDFHNVPWPLHMRQFGKKGKLKDFEEDQRRKLFTDIAKILNEHKAFSIASTLMSDQYCQKFNGLTAFSMYGACFVQLVVANGVLAKKNNYSQRIAYLLDRGNQYKHDVLDAHSFLSGGDIGDRLNIGTLGFDCDDNIAALQAADVVSWSIRRKYSLSLNIGFEPLESLFDSQHFEAPYSEEWMAEVAKSLRDKELRCATPKM